jgi:hypothetical protein
MANDFVILETELVEIRDSDHSHAFAAVGGAFECEATVDV